MQHSTIRIVTTPKSDHKLLALMSKAMNKHAKNNKGYKKPDVEIRE